MAKSALEEYGDVLEGIQNEEAVQSWLDSLGEGEHTVAMTEFRIKKSKKDKGNIVEADFVVLESTLHKKGDRQGWAWFIGTPGWPGKYAKGRNQAFMETVASCTDDKRPLKEVGADMLDGLRAGCVLEVKVTKVKDKDNAGEFLKRDNGEFVLDAKWFPIDQTKEDMAAMFAETKKVKTKAKPLESKPATESETPAEPPPAKKPNRFAGAKLG